MVKINPIDENIVQICGSLNNNKISGIAVKNKVNGCFSWQYDITAINHPKMIKLKSNSREGTNHTLAIMIERIRKELKNIA